ncbi:MAG: amidohydrolase family protein, partial [Candidatus Acidiferrales bacterium]
MMEKETRRRFFGSLLGAAAAATPLFANISPREALSQSPEADLVLLNGNVFTVDDQQPHAEAFAIKHSRFVAVGSSHDVENLIGKRTQVIDATGMTVLPGLIDAHSHPAWGGIEELVSVDCDLRSVEEIKAAIHQRALATPPGNWVLGFKYDDVRVREKRRITREDLDEVAPNNPVRIQHRGGHLCWYNSIAFA